MIDSIQTTKIFNQFATNLESIFSEFSLSPSEKNQKEISSYDQVLAEIVNQYIDVSDFISQLSFDQVHQHIIRFLETRETSCERIIIAPCSILFTSILEQIGNTFPQAIFVDSHCAGNAIGGKIIISPEELVPNSHDVCVIMTRNTQAIQSYKTQFGSSNCIDLLEAYIRESQEVIRPSTMEFIDVLNKETHPVLFSSAKPMGTLTSTIDQMAKDGYATYWMGSEDVKDIKHTGYATPQTSDLNLRDYAIGGLLDMLFTFCRMQQGTIFFHYEALFPPSWDFRRAAICYAACLAVIRTVKEFRVPGSSAKLVLHMYDAIKPGVKHYEAGVQASATYKQMLAEAEGVVFSSYTTDFGDFVCNAMQVNLPRVHCHRYQRIPEVRQKRLAGAYHIAIVSVLLEEFWEPSRTGFKPYIAEMLATGIHIHYYVGVSSRATAEVFRTSLPIADQSRFHLHDPIHSPHDLAYELSQYHAGWSLFNMQIFNDMTTYIDDQFMKDAMGLFTPTTLPSVIWSCAAAGLPVICNRDMRGVVDMLPEGMSIPLTLSEIGNMKNILDKVDWAAVDRCDLSSLDIENQIFRLYEFMDTLHAKK
jgi:hypothetical protein